MTYSKVQNKSGKRPKRESDFFLVQQALCGDQRAYRTIFDTYYQVVRYNIDCIVYDRDAAADICMETFERAFENLARFRPDYQLSAWLVRIGTNRALDSRRDAARKTMISVDEGFDEETGEKRGIELPDTGDTPDTATERLQDIELVKSVLVLLPEWEATAVRMRYLDGCSYDEIAEEFDMPRKKARKLVKIGLNMLLQVMDGEAGLDMDIRHAWQ